MKPTPHQLLVREMILQLKTGQLDAGYFRRKFGVEILDEWRDVWRQYAADELMEIDGDRNPSDPHRPLASRRPAAGLLRAGTPACAVHLAPAGRPPLSRPAVRR